MIFSHFFIKKRVFSFNASLASPGLVRGPRLARPAAAPGALAGGGGPGGSGAAAADPGDPLGRWLEALGSHIKTTGRKLSPQKNVGKTKGWDEINRKFGSRKSMGWLLHQKKGLGIKHEINMKFHGIAFTKKTVDDKKAKNMDKPEIEKKCSLENFDGQKPENEKGCWRAFVSKLRAKKNTWLLAG